MPWKLLFRNVLGHPMRSVLTIGSVAVAVFLVCILHAVTAGLRSTVSAASADRLLVQSAVSLFVDLPLSYQQKMAGVPGIEAICKWQWFGGRYEQDKGGFFQQFGIDTDTFRTSYPEISLIDGSYEEFVKNRTACLIGTELAEKYDWRVGQTVPITGTIYQRTDGKAWEFLVAGIYESSSPSIDQQTLWFHFDYLHESLEAGGASGPEGVGVYMLRMAKGTDPISVQRTVDAMFENGPQRVNTTTEAEFNRQFVSMLGDVPSLLQMVGGAVLFAIFFAVLNTMIMAGRERTRDLGIMKAIGFTDRTTALLLVGESVLVCSLGAAVGILGGLLLEKPFQAAMSSFIPAFAFDKNTLLLGAAIALGTGLISGLVPGWRAARLTTVQALREVG
ncbi:MAG: ABC transporter permease [Planctomycetes bacterium]|jgi:putative ABC transport system permease protein|nr:ABC transporter permease [Planctomycetota bacterium]MCC7062017.1 ABC transporter permease [Planctomycetota bacterium]